MKIVLRDDDLSYYSDVKKLKSFYEPLFNKGIKVSFSTIAFQKKAFNRGNFDKYYEVEEYTLIGNNKELVKWIKLWIEKGSIEIMLHGSTHEYMRLNNKWYGETYWKDKATLEKDLRNAKKYLENLFNVKILSYVPPSNDIGCKGMKVLKNIGIKYISGTITPKYNRCFNFKNTFNWFRYIIYYFLNNKNRFPGVLNGNLKEITYYTISPTCCFKDIQNNFIFCKNNNAIFVLATHHWELFDNNKLKKNFEELLSSIDGEYILFKKIF